MKLHPIQKIEEQIQSLEKQSAMLFPEDPRQLGIANKIAALRERMEKMELRVWLSPDFDFDFF
jgi:hypothetical protein